MKFTSFLTHAAYILVLAIFFFYMRDQQEKMERDIYSLRVTVQTQDLRVTEQGTTIAQWAAQVQDDIRRIDDLHLQLTKQIIKKPTD